MPSEAVDVQDDIEQLRCRFEEFRRVSKGITCTLASAREFVGSSGGVGERGVNPTARALRLDYTGLRKRVEKQNRPKQKRTTKDMPPTFMEFVAPGAKAVTNCTVEVESVQGGKLRLELRAVATTELADLIRAFVSR